jgi:DNA sulfur modification protein DndD
MKIEYMRIENWRSFYGVNEISFSTDPEKNVTLVRAENGVGKTSLLAALNWCLFGILPPNEDFQNPNNLLNNHALQKDGATQTKIELDFKHTGKVYKASRTYDQNRHRTNALRLVELKDGVETPLSRTVNVDRFINSVLPKEMAPHFFFYGEATARYADESGAKAFGAAVKNILGATVAGMALGDLEKAFKAYNKEATDNSSDDALKKQEQIDKIEASKDDLLAQLEAAENEEAAAEKFIENIDKQLRGAEQVGTDQSRRDKLTMQLQRSTSRLEQSVAESQKWFDNHGTALLAKSFVSDVKNLLDKEDTRKKIPGPFNKKFVNEVLEDELCICGRSIGHGSDEEKNVKLLLSSATDETMINRILSTNIALGRLEEKSKNSWNVRQKSHDEQIQIRELIALTEVELKEISERLITNDIPDIAKKEESRKKAKSKLRLAISDQGRINNILTDNVRRIEALQRERDALLKESRAAQRFVKRAQLAGQLSSRLKSRLYDEETFARIDIKLKIDKIISAFMRKPLTVEIDENYRVTVKDEDGNIASNSTGEKQMLGLAFTGAIASFASDRTGEEDDILLSGTEAPLVVDSPFGHLDSSYRSGVANFLPKMAPQIILLISSSQASAEVLEEIEQRIGSEYILRRYEQTDLGNRTVETIVINDQNITLTQYNHEFTGTRIEEVV